MTEADFHRELICGQNLLSSSDPLSRLLCYQALERCRNFANDNNRVDLEELLPNGWRRIAAEVKHA